ncbi:hypothetical protein PhCBS80983_g00877 [Powellomyces hirtus]|uniref:Uncharacterized protein n=1 Tax=Powellomyces hirtus TaxID=109895 RepID=A0A507EFF0_9FUNG|nr:hypothetical protein PhCBS80983_g00877 [Powellomyces hirtus]
MSNMIRLFDSSGTTIVDSIATDYEDSFSLETFGELIQAHYECDPVGSKAFIIARVQTWDMKQPGRAFYSYYNAYHLNRILFQTQVYLGKKLIHRLHVLNPLTNTDIIGDVQYFMVRIPVADGMAPGTGTGGGGEQVGKEKHGKKDTDDQPSILATALANDDKKNPESEGLLSRRGNRPSTAPSRASKVPSIITSPTTPSPGSGGNRYRTNLPPPSPSVRELESNPLGMIASWTLMGPLVSEITEEEPTGPGPLRRKFSLATMRMASPYPAFPPGPKSAQPMLETDIPGEFVLNIPPPSPVRGNSGTSSTSSGSYSQAGSSAALFPEVKIITKPPQGMLMLNSLNKRPHRVNIPVGTVTRFANPVPRDALTHAAQTPPVRRRSLSMLNHAPKKWEAAAKSTGKTMAITSSSDTLAIAEFTSLLPSSITSFDAVLFATDTDYLETSRTRATFRANAVVLEDVKLFEMPEFTGEDSPLPFVVIDDSPLCECCFPSNEALNNMSPPWRWFHRTKVWICILCLAGLLAFLVARYAKSAAEPYGLR